MKIEICSDTYNLGCAAIIGAIVVFCAFMIYKYNSLAFEKGYTQKQLENSQMVIWVKPGQ